MPATEVFVGSPAPDFELPCTGGAGVASCRAALADYRGKWLVLVFYPRDFSLVCPTELTALSDRIDEFHRNECELLGISVDSVESHARWLATPISEGGLGGLSFPLASDEDGSVAGAYGVYAEEQKVCQRGLFIIDPEGTVQCQTVHNHKVGRGTDELLRVLAALRTGGLCSADWSGESPLDPVRLLEPGRVVSHYRIEELVGSGTFGAVFRAHDMTLERTVALKVLKPEALRSPNIVLVEARSAAALNHANVCTIYAVDDSAGIPVIAMEFLSGQPLSHLLAGGALTPDRAAALGRQIALGLADAHAHGISHGDLKPANIMITDDDIAKILDFGLARREEGVVPSDTAVSVDGSEIRGITGTVAYMSPEQARGKRATPQSDAFSFGLILYEMATGQKIVAGDFLEALSVIHTIDPERFASDVSEPFAQVLREALMPDAAERTITMKEIAERLA